MQIRNRIKEMRLVPAGSIRPNPKNWRTHPKNQQDALRGVLSEVGIADAVIARECEDGGLMLIDGHLRTETLGNELIPVLVLDVSEAEADKLLATMDPLAELARTDESKLGALLQTITTESEALESMLSAMVDFDDLGLDATEEEDDLNDSNPDDAPDEPPPSGVRMVQLFFNEQTIVLFQERIDALSRAYGLDNITDTVFEAIYRESLSLQKQV